VHGNLYGTSHAEVQSVCDAGKVCVCEMDVQGVKQVHSSWQPEPKPFFLFIEPPSMKVLEERLDERGTGVDEGGAAIPPHPAPFDTRRIPMHDTK
jgi:guanylate kinase